MQPHIKLGTQDQDIKEDIRNLQAVLGVSPAIFITAGWTAEKCKTVEVYKYNEPLARIPKCLYVHLEFRSRIVSIITKWIERMLEHLTDSAHPLVAFCK